MTNNAIEDALAGDASADTASAVSDQIITTYMSATLRYLNKMDKDVAGGATTAGWKNQGEGWGFSLVIAEYLGISEKDVEALLVTLKEITDGMLCAGPFGQKGG